MLELLKKTRLYKGYHQYEMAKILGISKGAYNRKENGWTEFTRGEMMRIIDRLELNVDDVNKIFFANSIGGN